MDNHRFRCALCNHTFETEGRATKCPRCGAKALVHEEGRALKAKSCGGNCGCCSGCGH